MGFNQNDDQPDDQSADVVRRLVRRGMRADALRDCPPAALREFDRYLTTLDGGMHPADADQYDEDVECAKLRGQAEKFSEQGSLPASTPVGQLIAGFRSERRHGGNPKLTAEEFLGRR